MLRSLQPPPGEVCTVLVLLQQSTTNPTSPADTPLLRHEPLGTKRNDSLNHHSFRSLGVLRHTVANFAVRGWTDNEQILPLLVIALLLFIVILWRMFVAQH